MTTTSLTPQEAADRLRVSRATVYNFCKSGRLPHFRLGLGRGAIRIDQRDLEALLADCRVGKRPLDRPPPTDPGA